MAKNISLWGANYTGVPAVQLPQTGGGTAVFYDTTPVDITSDCTFHSAAAGNVTVVGKMLCITFTVGSLSIPADDWVTVITLPSSITIFASIFFSLNDFNGNSYIARVVNRTVQILSATAKTMQNGYGNATVPIT